VPLDSVYRWPALAGVAMAVTGATPLFRFEELCGTPAAPQDPREYAVAARAVVANPEAQWQLQAQVLHWLGDTWLGGQLATSVFNAAVAALRTCQGGAPSQSITTAHGRGDQRASDHAHLPGRASAKQHHQRTRAVGYGAARSAIGRRRQMPCVLEAMTAPLCAAYISSCQ
jgi:hypothetical protein